MLEIATTEPIDGDSTGTVWFYNVSAAVGLGRANNRVDVKLVQYLLIRLFDRWKGIRPPGPPISVDGFCGPITARYIGHFQRRVMVSISDGIVNRAYKPNNTARTIVALNLIYNAQFGDLNDPWAADPTMDGELAWAMYGALMQASSTAA